MKPTSQEWQEKLFSESWLRLPLVAEPRNRRLFAAIHYMHVATRLARAGATVGEFLAEVILNFSKVLEVLFPPAGDGKTRDAVRAGLRQLGYCDDDIEKLFLPAMALRNEIDVGHVELALFSIKQLSAIHAYTEVAEASFKELLNRVFSQIADGSWSLSPFVNVGLPRGTRKVISRLEESFGSEQTDETD